MFTMFVIVSLLYVTVSVSYFLVMCYCDSFGVSVSLYNIMVFFCFVLL